MDSSSTSHVIEKESLLSRSVDCSDVTLPEETASRSSLASVLGKKSFASTALHRSMYVPVLVLGYAVLAIFAWTVTCILSHRPITTDSYGVSYANGSSYYASGGTSIYVHSLYVRNEQWFHVARVIQSTVTVLTIPLTSAVCSKAAVIFIQRQSGLTLRQTMVLADKGWTDPKLYTKLVFGLKRYGSSFLFFAILLNILGGIISPLQSLFLTSNTIKTPTQPSTFGAGSLTDIMDLFNPPIPGSDEDIIPGLVRSIITSTSNTDQQSFLWTGNSTNCTLLIDGDATGLSSGPEFCLLGGITLGNMSSFPDPFLAQLPSGYNTGLIRQFFLRINSSATREVIAEANFPANCDTLPGSFYVNYANTVENGNWSLIACMPANQTQSPWKPVRTRQDFSEELYLNLSVSGLNGIRQSGGVFKFTLNTTAGYFELPNYMNGQMPGPLLDDDPNNSCGLDCAPQGFNNDPIHDQKSRRSPTRRDNTNGTNVFSNSSVALEMSLNRGPLLTTAIALFGEGSFIFDRLAHPEAYINNITEGGCIGQAPLIGLLHSEFGQRQPNLNLIDPCLFENNDNIDLQAQIATFVFSLYFNYFGGDDGERIKNAFESAAFLTNKAWLQSTSSSQSFTVSYDVGADTLVPVISRTGITLISVLLAMDLLALITMAFYSAWSPSWTGQLDAFVMMRIGAAIAESIPFWVADTTDQIKFLDETPGWVGDVTEGKGNVGELGLGAPTPLRGRRKYACY